MFDNAHRTLADVPRWTIVRTLRRQSVAEHSYFVALYAVEIAKFLNWEGEYYQLMMHALTDDLGEVISSDLPSPLKRAMTPPERARLDAWVRDRMEERSGPDSAYMLSNPGAKARAIVKLADHLEAAVFLAEERALGNNRVKNTSSYIAQHLEAYYKFTFAPMFELDLGYLQKGGILWSKMLEAISAATMAEQLVRE